MALLFSVYVFSADSKIYKNSKYGFELSFPDTWSRYKIVELQTNWPAGITVITWYVCLATKDSTYSESKEYPAGYAPVVAFTLFTHEQFRKIKEDNEKNKDIMPVEDIEIFKQNKKYIVNYSGPQALPPDLDERIKEISTVMNTFKFTDSK
jgi:hypothetical protein